MGILRKISRRSLRIILKYLCLTVIGKHRPDIIAIIGSGPTGIIREAVYTLLHESYPVRRNLESPESEFSVPLTILGYSKYPENGLQWLTLIFRVFRQWLTTKPYFHILVLEMGTENMESLSYWLEITQPKFIVVSGQAKILESFHTGKSTVINCPAGLDNLKHSDEAVSALASYYHIPEEQVRELPEKVTLPISRITLRQGKGKKLILDSTYYYYPSPLKAVMEVAEALPAPIVYLLDDNLVRKEGPQIKDTVVSAGQIAEIRKYKTIVVRGQKTKMRSVLDSL